MGSGASRHSKNVVGPQPVEAVRDEAMETYLQEFRTKKLEQPEIDFLEHQADFIKAKFVIENATKGLKTGSKSDLTSLLKDVSDAYYEYKIDKFHAEFLRPSQKLRVLSDQCACDGLDIALQEFASTLFACWHTELDQDVVTDATVIYRKVLHTLLNTSSESPIVCHHLMESGFLAEILRNLMKEPYVSIHVHGHVEDILKKYKEDAIKDIVFYYIGLLFNSLRCGVKRSYFVEHGVIETMTHFKTSEDDVFRLMSYMMLDVVNLDRETGEGHTDDDSITHCLKLLHKNDISDSSVEYIKYGYGTISIEAVAYSIRATANNRQHHEKLLSAGLLEVCEKLMARKTESEQYYGVEIIYHLSFNDDCKTKLKENKSIIKSLLTIRSLDTGSQRVKKAAHGALSNLQDKKEKTVSDKAATNKSGHIMISYPWRYQSLIIKIKKFLERNGYGVWIDVEKMGGSLTESMADAVNNASIVLICIAEAYYESPNCRREAEYAMEHGKHIIPLRLENYKPMNWLGLVVAQRLYVDFTQSMDKGLDDLMKRVAKQAQSGSSVKSVVADRIKPSMRYHPAKKWSEMGVAAWLKQNNLEFLSVELTGPNLVSMMHLRIEAPEFFYDYAHKELGVKNMEEIGKLSTALDKLETLTSADSY